MGRRPRIERPGAQYRELAERRDRPRGLAAFAVIRREPIEEEDLANFWKRYVRPDAPAPWPAEILRSAGVPL